MSKFKEINDLTKEELIDVEKIYEKIEVPMMMYNALTHRFGKKRGTSIYHKMVEIHKRENKV